MAPSGALGCVCRVRNSRADAGSPSWNGIHLFSILRMMRLFMSFDDRSFLCSKSHASGAQLRIMLFFGILGLLIWSLDAMITYGLTSISTSVYGSNNRIMRGAINAQILITGSSRAASHYDPRIIRLKTGRSAFNLGRNGSQTDMQVAVFKAYLKHNRKPEIVLHNLDAFTFQTTREVYNAAQYVPYLYEEDLYQSLRKINPNVWKSRYLPLYGYVVEDMSFAWMLGLKAFLPWGRHEDLLHGFDPRATKWTDEFQHFKDANRQGVHWDIEREGIRLMEELISLCQERGVRLIFVYSPEYAEMQALTRNRDEIFDTFRAVASRTNVPIWDYSNWRYRGITHFFANSQHLNAAGAEVFSRDVAAELANYIPKQAAGSAVQGNRERSQPRGTSQ
jgi:hypothetical protein